MLIQCQSCTHKFRLNLERLPARKTFVRCKNCGTPIYIHGEEEEAAAPSGLPEAVTVPEHLAESPVIPPWMAGMPPEGAADSAVVTCPQCDSRYRMPVEPLRRPEIKLKCTQCEHIFIPPPDLRLPQRPEASAVLSPEVVARATVAPEFAPPPGAEHERVIPPERVIPEPDEQRMSALLDDMAPESGIRRSTPTPPFKDTSRNGAPDSEQAYLEATSLGEEFSLPERGTVPEQTKYGLFLKPGELPTGRMEGAPAPEPPPTPPVEPPPVAPVFEAELPPLDEVPVAAPPKEAAPPPPPPAPPPPEPVLEAELPPLPMLAPEQPRKPPTKQVVPDQFGWLSTRNRYIALGVAAAILLVVAGMWTVWLWNAPGSSQPYTVETGRVHQLALEDKLEGRYIVNKPSGQRLFIVQGTVENHFPSGTEISWVRLRGSAYTDRNQTQTLATSFAFIGNVLSDAQLAAWELDAIQAFYAYNNGRDNTNFRIPPGAKVPFQLVFANVKQPVGRTVAQVVSYHRNNLTVYVDPGR